MNKISLITAYYKNEEMTCDFLDNLIGKLPEETEVILVNAGSIPIEHDIVSRRIDLQDNQSFSNSFNAGLRRAAGDYICIINNDAFPQTETWLQDLIELLQETHAWIASPSNDKSLIENYPMINDCTNYWEVEFFPAVCWVLRKEHLKEIGLFDERFIGGNYEDNDYCKRMQDLGGNLIVSKHVKINHLESQTLKLLDNKNLALENYQRFTEKYS